MSDRHWGIYNKWKVQEDKHTGKSEGDFIPTRGNLELAWIKQPWPRSSGIGGVYNLERKCTLSHQYRPAFTETLLPKVLTDKRYKVDIYTHLLISFWSSPQVLLSRLSFWNIFLHSNLHAQEYYYQLAILPVYKCVLWEHSLHSPKWRHPCLGSNIIFCKSLPYYL